MKAVTDIQYGRVEHPWALDIEEWTVNADEDRKSKEFESSLDQNFPRLEA